MTVAISNGTAFSVVATGNVLLLFQLFTLAALDTSNDNALSVVAKNTNNSTTLGFHCALQESQAMLIQWKFKIASVSDPYA